MVNKTTAGMAIVLVLAIIAGYFIWKKYRTTTTA